MNLLGFASNVVKPQKKINIIKKINREMSVSHYERIFKNTNRRILYDT